MDLAELHLPRSVAYVGLARSVVTSGARLAGLANDRLEDLKIAVSEAATQAVTGPGGDGALVLAFGVHQGAYEVHVLDAVPAARAAAEQPVAGPWPEAGSLSLTLVEGLADEVVFPEDSRTQLVLRFTMDAPAPAGSRGGAAAKRPR